MSLGTEVNFVTRPPNSYLQPINKMFATYYYDPAMSKVDFDYQLVSFEESLRRISAEMLNE